MKFSINLAQVEIEVAKYSDDEKIIADMSNQVLTEAYEEILKYRYVSITDPPLI